ncbi:hypothetical protein ACTQ6A_14160 [Lachnospiraceae bacterium LCP25S3_G4]
MTDEQLKKATDLKNQIDDIKGAIFKCERNRDIRIFKKKRLCFTVSDYMREIVLFDMPQSLRPKFIELLKSELEELEKQLREV